MVFKKMYDNFREFFQDDLKFVYFTKNPNQDK